MTMNVEVGGVRSLKRGGCEIFNQESGRVNEVGKCNSKICGDVFKNGSINMVLCFHPQRYKHGASGEFNLTRAAVLTNELIK